VYNKRLLNIIDEISDGFLCVAHTQKSSYIYLIWMIKAKTLIRFETSLTALAGYKYDRSE